MSNKNIIVQNLKTGLSIRACPNAIRNRVTESSIILNNVSSNDSTSADLIIVATRRFHQLAGLQAFVQQLKFLVLDLVLLR